MKRLFQLAPLFIFLLLALVMWVGLSRDPKALPSKLIGQPLPELALPMLDTSSATLHLADLKGRMTLLNVWASWCDACRDEQAFLLQLAKQGVPIVGLNYQDNLQNAKTWLSQWGNPFEAVGVDTSGRMGIELGVYGTPETFLIDENGVVRYRFAGILNRDVWTQTFLPLMCARSPVPAYCE